MTPEDAAPRLCGNAALQERIVQVVLDRAPKDAVVGGHEALRQIVAGLVRDWARTADAGTATGGKLYYG